VEQQVGAPDTSRLIHVQIEHEQPKPHGGAVLFARARLRRSDDGQRFHSALVASGLICLTRAFNERGLKRCPGGGRAALRLVAHTLAADPTVVQGAIFVNTTPPTGVLRKRGRMRIERGLQPFNNHTLSNGPTYTERVLTSPRRPHCPQSTSSLTTTADTKNAENIRLPTHPRYSTRYLTSAGCVSIPHSF
jgi:hypothetical protein